MLALLVFSGFLMAVLCLWKIHFEGEFFPCLCSAASVSLLTGCLLFMSSSDMRLLNFLMSNSIRSFPLSFRCAPIGLAFLLNSSNKIIPYLCKRASFNSWGFVEVKDFGCMLLHRQWVLVWFWSRCSYQNHKVDWRKYHWNGLGGLL